MSEPFGTSVAISKSMKPISNNGWLQIADGQVQLYDGKGEVLAEAPASQVWAKSNIATMGAGISLWIGEQKYMVSQGSGSRPGFVAFSGAGVGSNAVANGRKFGKVLFAALEAAGGHHGKP